MIKASRSRRRKIEPDSEGRKGDFSVYTCDGEDSQLLLLLECKPPRGSSSDDVVKLANCLKDCIDEATLAGADDLEVDLCGIVCEGTSFNSGANRDICR